MIRTHVMICGGTGCTSSDSPKIAEAMERRRSSNWAFRMKSRSCALAASASARWAPS